MFRSIKTISKNVKIENILFMGLKLIVQKIFKNLNRDNKLMLSPTKEGVLDNFLSLYSTIITKTTTTPINKSALSTMV